MFTGPFRRQVEEVEIGRVIERVKAEGLRRDLSERSRERAAQFSWEKTAARTFAALRECLV